MPPRRGRLVALLLMAALVVSGCGLATSSPVQPGLRVDAGGDQPVRVRFPGPSPGATPEQIVRGFIRAGSATGGDYATAREFLTDEAAKAWQPDIRVDVLSTRASLAAQQVTTDSVRLKGTVEATMDAEGRYRPQPPQTSGDVTITLAQRAGEWRIAGLPKGFGRWVATVDVRRLFRPYAVHYLATDRRLLIPDYRWFPVDHLASRLARAQLSPVPAHLRGVATTAIPAGARLTADSVAVSGGVATIDLGTPLPADTQARTAALAQLVSTAVQDPQVTAVEVRADGVALDVPLVEQPISTAETLGFPPAATPTGPLIAREAGTLRVFDPTDPEGRRPQRPSGLPSVGSSFVDLAVAADHSEVAAISTDRRQLSRWRGDTRYETAAFGTELGRPSYDQRGYLWVGGVGSGQRARARLWTVPITANPADRRVAVATPVGADWLVGRVVVESRVAADGERIAVLSTRPDGSDSRVDLAGVVRGADGQPQQLSPPLRLGAALAQVRALTWVDDASLVVLARGGLDEVGPQVIRVDGEVRTLPPVQGTRVTTDGTERGVYVVTDDGRLLGRAGQQWVPMGAGSDLVLPGG